MRVLFFANTDWYLYNFRRPLLAAVRERGHDVVLLSPMTGYGPRLQAEGFRWIELPMNRRSANLLTEWDTVRRVHQVLKDAGPGLLHNFTIKCVVYGSLAARLAGPRAVVNGLDGLGYVFSSTEPKARLLRPVVTGLLRLAMSGADRRVIVQNAQDRDLLLAGSCVDAGRLALVAGGVGVDLDRFMPVALAGDDVEPVVLFASRLILDKGIAEFVCAARQLKADGVRARFVVAGVPDAGNPAAVTGEQLREWESWGCVEFAGHVDDMPRLLSTASVVVLVTAYGEGLPRILIEGAASGLPLIASDHAACRAVVDDGVNGLIVPPRNVAALVDAMRRLIGDPALRKRMGVAGRQKAEAEFDEQAIVARTLDVYRELVPAI